MPCLVSFKGNFYVESIIVCALVDSPAYLRVYYVFHFWDNLPNSRFALLVHMFIYFSGRFPGSNNIQQYKCCFHLANCWLGVSGYHKRVLVVHLHDMTGNVQVRCITEMFSAQLNKALLGMRICKLLETCTSWNPSLRWLEFHEIHSPELSIA